MTCADYFSARPLMFLSARLRGPFRGSGPRGGGGGDDRMGVKLKNQKIPRASNKTQNIPGPKNNPK